MPPLSARAPRFALIALAALFSVAGCEEDPTGPEPAEEATVAEVSGEYDATTFVGYESPGKTIDVLDEGGSLSITLNANGTTEGTMFVPGGDEDGSDYTADLAGTWSLSGSTITFDHAADTFIRDVEWQFYEDGTIRSDSEFARVVLAP